MKQKRLFVSLILSMLMLFPAILRAEVSFPVRAKIKIFWRYVPAEMNPLDIKGAFTHSGTVAASKSPFGGGGITGRQIISLIEKKSGNKNIVRYRALSLKEGEEPANRPTLASIAVRDDNSLYDNYVIKTRDDDLVMYVDVLFTR